MRLNYEIIRCDQNEQAEWVLLIHGLFGSLSNLGMLARPLSSQFNILQIDLRNHGKSEHSEHMSYELMAQDVIETLDVLNIATVNLIGHSMGGKVAMKLTEIASNRVNKLIVLDMSPFAYKENHHDQIFAALIAVEDENITTRKEATEIMQKYITELGVIQFLLKSFHQGRWLFNARGLQQNYQNILTWKELTVWDKACLFLKGEHSEYIQLAEHFEAIHAQFPHAQIEMIHNAGHWLHAEQTQVVHQYIDQFL